MTTITPAAAPPDLVVTSRDGRRIAADLTGPESGLPVLLCHPAPGSRRFDPDPSVTAVAGVRLVTIDRPGYGGSDGVPGGMATTVTAHADDAAAVLDAAGTGPVLAVGWSAGGRVAAALAARRPDLVRGAVLVATPAPDEDVPWYGEEQRALTAVLSERPDHATAEIAGLLASDSGDAQAAAAMLAGGAADEAALGDPSLRKRLVAMLEAAFAQGALGVAGDIAAYALRPWGFEREDVAVPVLGVYGADDGMVPPAHGRWWCDGIARSRLEVVSGAGHLVVVSAWERVVAWAAHLEPAS